MSNETESRPEARAMELVGGIIADVQVLVKQQLALFRYEIKGEIVRVRDAGALVAAGLTIALTGGVLLCGMLVHLLAWAAPGLPLWACYGIVGAPIAVLGAVLCLVGIQKFKYFNTSTAEPVPDLEENTDG